MTKPQRSGQRSGQRSADSVLRRSGDVSIHSQQRSARIVRQHRCDTCGRALTLTKGGAWACPAPYLACIGTQFYGEWH